MIEEREAPSYVLGHTGAELQRLVTQARFYGDLTEDILRRAGLALGMRVLDLGCGVGDVSFLAASLVGPTGSVVGVDRSPDAIVRARERAAAADLYNVDFLQAELITLELAEKFDAIIGRFVLLYLADPAATLRQLTRMVRPGGIVALQEMDMSTARSMPEVPAYRACVHWIGETFRRGGVELDMGSRLFSIFRDAGLPQPELLLRARIEGAQDSPAYTYVAQTLQSVLPMAERLGVATAQEAQIETFAERLRQEVIDLGAVIVLPSLVGAWARMP